MIKNKMKNIIKEFIEVLKEIYLFTIDLLWSVFYLFKDVFDYFYQFTPMDYVQFIIWFIVWSIKTTIAWLLLFLLYLYVYFDDYWDLYLLIITLFIVLVYLLKSFR